MSKSLGKHEWRPLAHYVQLDTGEKYFIDSIYVEGEGFVTLVRRTNDGLVIEPDHKSISWLSEDYDKMVITHYKALDHLEDFL